MQVKPIHEMTDAEKLSFIAKALKMKGAAVNGNWVTPEGAVYNWLRSNADCFSLIGELKMNIQQGHKIATGELASVAAGWGVSDYFATGVEYSGDINADLRLAITNAAIHSGINQTNWN